MEEEGVFMETDTVLSCVNLGWFNFQIVLSKEAANLTPYP